MGAVVSYAPKQSANRKWLEVSAFNKLGHLVIGTAIGLLITHNLTFLIAIVFGSLLPDIDKRGSTLGRYNPFVRLMKHRGHMHSLFGSAIISLPFALLGIDIYLMALIGCILHLLADKLSSWLPHRARFKLKLW